MRAVDLLVAVERIGGRLEARGHALRLVAPRGAVSPELLDQLQAQKPRLLRALSRERVLTPAGDGSRLLDRFLSDASIPAAVFHSRALGRDFVLARDEAALEALTEADQALPVLFFTEGEALSRLELEGLRAVLDVRAEFGPSAMLRKVRG